MPTWPNPNIDHGMPARSWPTVRPTSLTLDEIIRKPSCFLFRKQGAVRFDFDLRVGIGRCRGWFRFGGEGRTISHSRRPKEDQNHCISRFGFIMVTDLVWFDGGYLKGCFSPRQFVNSVVYIGLKYEAILCCRTSRTVVTIVFAIDIFQGTSRESSSSIAEPLSDHWFMALSKMPDVDNTPPLGQIQSIYSSIIQLMQHSTVPTLSSCNTWKVVMYFWLNEPINGQTLL